MHYFIKKIFFILCLLLSVGPFMVYALSTVQEDVPPIFNKWAWNATVGWIKFLTTDNSAVVLTTVTPYELRGYAQSDNIGNVYLDCATYNLVKPATLNCGSGGLNPESPLWKITWDWDGVTGSRNLQGYAWNDQVGWISFNCKDDHDDVTPGTQSKCAIDGGTDYAVHIASPNASNIAELQGFAWNESIGWISFNCTNDHDGSTPGTQMACSTPTGLDNYRVKTAVPPPPSKKGVLISRAIDSGIVGGAQWNSIVLNGARNSGTVQLWVASGVTAGDLPTSATVPPTDTRWKEVLGDFFLNPISLPFSDHHNKRYFRYMISLEDNSPPYPQIEDVIIHWSP